MENLYLYMENSICMENLGQLLRSCPDINGNVVCTFLHKNQLIKIQIEIIIHCDFEMFECMTREKSEIY